MISGKKNMGGIGSGTWYRWNRKPTCETVIQIDIRELHRADALRPGQSGNIHWESDEIKFRAEPDYLILVYRYQSSDGLSRPVLERVPIDRIMAERLAAFLGWAKSKVA